MNSKELLAPRYQKYAIMVICIFTIILTSTMACATESKKKSCPINGISCSTCGSGNGYSRHLEIQGGTLRLDFADLKIEGLGPTVTLTRTYRSDNAGIASCFGYGWTTNIDVRLDNDSGIVRINNADVITVYSCQYDGSYLPAIASGRRLYRNTDGWREVYEDSAVINYDTEGRMTAVSDKNGNMLVLEYEGDKLQRIVDAAGRVTILKWTGDYVSKVIDPGARTHNYEYSNGELITYENPAGYTMIFTYDNMHHITGIVNDKGDADRYSYDIEGRVLSITNPENHTRSYTYIESDTGHSTKIVVENGGAWLFNFDNYDNLLSKVDPAGNRFEEVYGARGMRIGERCADGTIIKCNYNSNGDQTQLEDAAGNVQQYTYSGNLLTGRTFANGDSESYEYDYAGNMTKYTDRMGFSEEFAYNTYGQRTGYKDKCGNWWNYSYDQYGYLATEQDPLGNTKFYVYDVVGNRMNMTDANGHTTYYTYDNIGRITQVMHPDYTHTTSSYDCCNKIAETDENGYTTTFSYNRNNYPTCITDPLGYTIEYGYDAMGNRISEKDKNGNITQYMYYSMGSYMPEQNPNRLWMVILPDNNTIIYQYDEEGRKIAEVNQNGDTTYYEYDRLGRLLKTTDVLGNSKSVGYDVLGRLITDTDARGSITRYEYDANDRLIMIYDAHNNRMEYGYDANGNQTSVRDRRGNTTTYAYNAANRLVCVTDPLMSTMRFTYDAAGNRLTLVNGRSKTIGYVYDSRNRITRIVDPYSNSIAITYDNNGNRHTVTGPLNNMTTYAYDELNRVTAITDPQNHSSYIAYYANGNRLCDTDANGNVTRFQYDFANRLVQVTNALGHNTIYSYDALGNKISMTDANGHVTTYNYDDAGRLISTIDPINNEQVFAYDANGNRIESTDGRGITTSYYYDELNRLVFIDYPGSDSDVAYTYDANGNKLTMANTWTDFVRTYDARNRVLAERDNKLGKTVSYTYDANGNRATMTNGENGDMIYTYDDADRLIALVNSEGQQTDFQYDAAGRMMRRNYANGTYTEYYFDNANRMICMANYKSTGETICGNVYTYDNVGNRTAKVYADGDTEIYDYDDLYRLTNVQTKDKMTIYDYDAVGNRMRMVDGGDTTVYVYSIGDELMCTVNTHNTGDTQNPTVMDTETFVYDGNGNQVTKITNSEVWHYGFDANDMLISVATETQEIDVRYMYIPDGRQVRQIANGITTNYFYDEYTPLSEYDSATQREVCYTYSIKTDDIISAQRGDSTSWYHKDAQGSVMALTNENETNDNAYRYDPFGTIIFRTRESNNDVTYTGRRYDSELGMFYYRSRYYSSSVGRFYRRDDYLGEASNWRSLHRYNYCYNNPVIYNDPYGFVVSYHKLTDFTDLSDGYVYTKNCGWLDIDHISDYNTIYGKTYNAINSNTPATINIHTATSWVAGFGLNASLTPCSTTSTLTADEVRRTAMALGLSIAVRQERHEYDVPALTIMTGFSTEDLTSDYVGLKIGLNSVAAGSGKLFNWMSNAEKKAAIESVCGPIASLSVAQSYYGPFFGTTTTAKERIFKPYLLDSSGHIGRADWIYEEIFSIYEPFDDKFGLRVSKIPVS